MHERAEEVLVVDDDEAVRTTVSRVLTRAGFRVDAACNAEEALAIIDAGKRFDVIVTDLLMPGMHGIEFLRRVRRIDLDVPLIVLTGNPTLETAIAVVEYGGFRYLEKPVSNETLCETVRSAGSMHHLAVLKRRALELCDGGAWLIGDRAGLDARFDRALEQLFIAFQPIVRWPERTIYGHEALVRSSEATLATPNLLFEAAGRLGRVAELGRAIRAAVAANLVATAGDAPVFINLHPVDLGDENLFHVGSPLSSISSRIVFELTERAPLHRVPELRERIARLRSLGFRIAVDNLGAGYAGLSSFEKLTPEVAKVDMSLVRGVDMSSRKANLVRALIEVCQKELGAKVVCEGVETERERDTLADLGADLMQGYLFARPAPNLRGGRIFASPGLSLG
jgi:EAL domain-containing protein (putative c-di-GMP-specific phosphodiesterase class I)/ActR/RegA family two-component response regulator